MNRVIEEAWPEWKPIRIIGEGSFSSVYLCAKQEHSVVASAAIKVIPIPHDKDAYQAKLAEGLSPEAIHDYYQKSVNECVNEIRILETIKGTPNIVHIEDFKVVTRTDDFGWYILIRMELLGSLQEALRTSPLSYNDAVRLGVDITSALTVCQKNHILHRDIKPANIMISPNGGFKLADFGISLQTTQSSGNASYGGTYLYMAPEVLKAESCDARSDLYSLGLVLYQLFNRNRLPFTDPDSRQTTETDRRNSIVSRRNGTPLPPPVDAGPKMADVILQACAYLPRDRFASAEQMRAALLDAQRYDAQKGLRDKKWVIALGIFAAVLAAGIGVLLYLYFLG